MELTPKHKKYLLYGGLGVAGLVIYSKMKAKSHEKKEAKAMAAATPATPAAPLPPFDPLNLPSGGSYPSSYPPPYVPPYQPPYQQPYYPPTPIQYPYPTPTLPIQYPTPSPIGYPSGYPSYPQYPAINYPAACRAVIGLTYAAARSRLAGLGILSQIVSINGKIQSAATSQRVGPVASLYLVYGRVSNATCTGGSTTYPATTYPNSPAVPYNPVTAQQGQPFPQTPTDTSTSVIPDGYF